MKLCIVFALLWVMGLDAHAQTQGIVFGHARSWKKIVAEARDEGKLIFVDCYSDKSESCKRLVSSVFTLKDVGDFFNEHFVNVRLDVEKDAEGKALASQWGVTSLPTLMFIDPEKGQIAGKLVGAGDGAWLVNGAKMALDPDKRLDAMAARYNAGERDPVFLKEFVQGLASAGMNAEVQQVVKGWLEGLTLDQLATPKVWQMIMQFENDPLSKTLQAVEKNIDRFYAIPLENQRAMVDAKLTMALVQTAMEFAKNPNLAIYEQDRFDAFVDYLANVKEGAGKTMAAVWLNTSQLSREGDWKQMLEVMQTVERENILPPQIYGQYFMFFMQSLTQMEDKKNAVVAGIQRLDGILERTSGEDAASYQTRAMMYAGKATLWQALGKDGEASKAKREMDKCVKLLKASAASGMPTAGRPGFGQKPDLPTVSREKVVLDKEVTLGYEVRQGVPVVKVVINWHTYYFLFDTGAGVTCVSDRLANTEKLACRQSGQTMQGMGQLMMAEVPELLLGELTVRNKQVAVMNERNPIFEHLGVDGIIGANVMNDYVVAIDARSKTIAFSSEADASITRWDTLKIWNDIPLISMKVKGKEEVYDVPALFDTGNGTGAIGLPSAEGFEQWTQAGIIGDVEEGDGFIGTMVGGMASLNKLYRGRMTEIYLGNAAFKQVPIITGGMGYLLLCFKITELGKFVLDYPNGRYHFEPYAEAAAWEGDRRPVMTGADNGVLKVATVWGKEVRKQVAPLWTVIALDGKPLENVTLDVPNIDELIRQHGAKTVTVRDVEGKEYEVKAEVFLPKEV